MVGDTYRLHPMSPRPQDVQATYCATLVDEWIRRGARHAVVAPGSRSTPMAIAVADRPELQLHVVHDERVAAFVALGIGLGGTPALLLCTSGTAAANFFPAVVEAGLSEVPMVVLTADRPEELRGVGAPQTIDQLELYGCHVRWFHDPGVPADAGRGGWRALAAETWSRAAGGPVQLNLAFREPLVGEAGPLPAAADDAADGVADAGGDDEAVPSTAERAIAAPVVKALQTTRGVVLVGGRSGVSPADVAELHRRTGWPIVADPLSNMRALDGAVSYADALLRVAAFADRHRPDVIVRVGRPAASKVLAQWSAACAVPVVQVGGPGVIDPDRNVAAVCGIADVLAARAASGATDPAWLASWLDADRRAEAAVGATLREIPEPTEPGVARTVVAHLPDDADLVVASSMPVRDLEWFGGRRARAHANRGANGIDGTLSTAVGRALTGPTTFVLVGDLAFVHDANALLALTARDADVRIVVVDNDGGGIFSFLPQATTLPTERFEALFGTPLGADLVGLASGYRVRARAVASLGELVDQLAVPGPWVAVVPSDRARNVAVHDALHAAVAAALVPSDPIA